MSETEVNIPLLRKAVEWAEAEAAKPPELCEWEQRAYRATPFDRAPECGTCYCVAGFVTATLDETYARTGKWPGKEPAAFAAEALGIPEFDGDPNAGAHLFSDENSIEDVRRIAESIAGERL